jgi:DNA-binding response OmpR family regulator
MTRRILVADDERGISGPLAYAFRKEGYEVATAGDGEEALRLVPEFRPDVLVLDVSMPKMSGYEVCRRLGNRTGMGIILLTVKNDVADKIAGLELGADDYMTKPFDLRELIARVKALIRRLETKPEEPARLAFGALSLDPIARAAEWNGRPLELTPKEFDVLALMLAHPNRVFTRDELLDAVWGFEYASGTRTVDIHIQRLRKKLGDDGPRMLQTVYGVGYKFSGAGR